MNARMICLYKGLSAILCNSLCQQLITLNKYKYSFFPRTVSDRNKRVQDVWSQQSTSSFHAALLNQSKITQWFVVLCSQNLIATTLLDAPLIFFFCFGVCVHVCADSFPRLLLIIVSVVMWCRYGDGYIMIGFSNGFFVVISTHMKEIGQVCCCIHCTLSWWYVNWLIDWLYTVSQKRKPPNFPQ